jgi:hypothetical protein
LKRSRAGVECAVEYRCNRARMVASAERFPFAGCGIAWCEHSCGGAFVHQPCEQCGRDERHVAGDGDARFTGSVIEQRSESGQGSDEWFAVGKAAKLASDISKFSRSDENGIETCVTANASESSDQCLLTRGSEKKSFGCAAHAAALSANEDAEKRHSGRF